MSTVIHSSAIVEDGVTLGTGVKIGPFAVVESGAVIGEKCLVESHAVVKGGARIGKKCRIGHFSVVAGDPQHLSFDVGLKSYVRMGDGCRIGEGVTLHRSMYENESTSVGHGVFLMGNSHVAHDSKLGDEVILANGALLGGHVEIGSCAFIGGGAGIHQFVRVGAGAMVGGLAEISADIGPHLLVVGRNGVFGLNITGLKRRNTPANEILLLKKLYKELLMEHGNISNKARLLLKSDSTYELTFLGREFLEFFTAGARGFARHSGKSNKIPKQ
ncbi:MAG: acyl-[acyl-carrier-protein]--UDP-N-acetylglucosamine O-acyltransferase [Verrucomicrobia bacterium TMED56]|jgi:UDP-N-acetylglucosamine acyltransferase|nr:MAG: acyl-[acyl-carrier-protein]--UDP-N-acetylglucosamine O-acyltransferase [Verrucomicrobia bacterium TMED56]